MNSIGFNPWSEKLNPFGLCWFVPPICGAAFNFPSRS